MYESKRMESSQILLRLGDIRPRRSDRSISCRLSVLLRDPTRTSSRHVLPVLLLPLPIILHLRNLRLLLDRKMASLPVEMGRGYRGRYWRYQDESYYIIRERYAK